MEKDNSGGKNATVSLIDEKLGGITDGIEKVEGKPEETANLNVSNYNVIKLDEVNGQDRSGDDRDQNRVSESRDIQDNLGDKEKHFEKCDKMDKDRESYSKALEEMYETAKAVHFEKEPEPVFDGTVVHGMESKLNSSTCSSGFNPEEGYIWPEKAVVLKNFVKEKGTVAVTSVLHHLSFKRDDVEMDTVRVYKGASNSSKIGEQTAERSAWNPLNYIMMSCTADAGWQAEQGENNIEGSLIPVVTKGKVLLYTRLGCQDCREVRWFLRNKRLRYVEINIDLYPSRKLELEKFSGSCAVPKVFFNEILIGGLSELKHLDMSGKIAEKIDFLITEAPSTEAPLSPLSGEDDVSCNGPVDELALIVQKMKRNIVAKERFYKMRRFTNCFLGSEAVDFQSEDQYLEREEVSWDYYVLSDHYSEFQAVEFGRKLASKLFFRHVLEIVTTCNGSWMMILLYQQSTQCHNTPRGMIELKPKPITEIASRLRFLFCAILEAYASEDGRRVDYRSVHGSEEFARYLRIIQELQRVDVQDMPREEKLAFFINLYNMMAIHAVLVWGHPNGSLEWRKLLGEFKYVVGGFTFSLSSIHNGILRCNQRPPFYLLKPFGVRDKRLQVALPYPEPLIHFALVCGTRSGPALQCYSSRNIDKELMDAARVFIRFSVDFGQNEIEVLKHASNYLEPTNAEALLEILADSQLTVIYQPYDWGLNCYG